MDSRKITIHTVRHPISDGRHPPIPQPELRNPKQRTPKPAHPLTASVAQQPEPRSQSESAFLLAPAPDPIPPFPPFPLSHQSATSTPTHTPLTDMRAPPAATFLDFPRSLSLCVQFGSGSCVLSSTSTP
uniref:Uncharacterized protein n=1 Tax=Oryza sativa subsp. japonica TaxID=39947 RepID=Q69SH1_ORYSJ|nr:hypothetical protein [Oryza sativa Japonica Group]BAD46034.1 hypothetical protein [Oryza sativa Japonica Group]